MHPLLIATDNAPAFKSDLFRRFIASRPDLVHIRTRHHSPETNGVVERFIGSLKDEHLFRQEIITGHQLAEEGAAYRQLYMEWRSGPTIPQLRNAAQGLSGQAIRTAPAG